MEHQWNLLSWFIFSRNINLFIPHKLIQKLLFCGFSFSSNIFFKYFAENYICTTIFVKSMESQRNLLSWSLFSRNIANLIPYKLIRKILFCEFSCSSNIFFKYFAKNNICTKTFVLICGKVDLESIMSFTHQWDLEVNPFSRKVLPMLEVVTGIVSVFPFFFGGGGVNFVFS